MDIHRKTVIFLRNNGKTHYIEYVNDLQYKLNLARVFIDSSCNHSPDQINCGTCAVLKDTEVTKLMTSNVKLRGVL